MLKFVAADTTITGPQLQHEFDRRPPDFLLLTLAAGVRLEKGRQIHNGMQEQRREIHRRWVSRWRS